MTWFLTSRLGRFIAMAAAIVVAILTFGKVQRLRGKSDADNEALKDAYDRVEKGRDSLQDGRNSGAAPDERLRDNDGKW